jgi:hypothetical protein
MWKEKVIQLHGQSIQVKYLDNEMGMSIVIKNPYFWFFTTGREWNSIVKRLEENIPLRRMPKVNNMAKTNDTLGDVVVIECVGGVPSIGVRS